MKLNVPMPPTTAIEPPPGTRAVNGPGVTSASVIFATKASPLPPLVVWKAPGVGVYPSRRRSSQSGRIQPSSANATKLNVPVSPHSDNIWLAVRCHRTYTRVMLDWSQCPTVERVPGKLSGVWVFKGMRVPVKSLFENLEDGARVDDFLTWFPGVTREQVEAVLEHAGRSLAGA